MLMHASLAAPDIYLRWPIAAVYIAKKYLSGALALSKRARAISARAMYDEKDTRRRKLLRCTGRFCRNVTIFAGRLSKAGRQLPLARASGASRRVSAIFI
jgi:hypothetical protein